MKKDKWYKSAAGKVSIALIIISAVLLIVAVILTIFYANKYSDLTINILIGLLTNLIGIIVTVSFVQFFLDRQSSSKKREQENARIKRYNRLMTIYIDQYSMFLYCITTPISNRKEQDFIGLNDNFEFKDMCDMYLSTLYTTQSISEPAIVMFFKAEKTLREYMIRILEDIEFEYNDSLRSVLSKFIEASLASDMRGAILGNMNIVHGNKKLSETMAKYIKSDSGEWVKMGDENKLGSNAMLPYYIFYQLLKEEIALLKNYETIVDNID